MKTSQLSMQIMIKVSYNTILVERFEAKFDYFTNINWQQIGFSNKRDKFGIF